MRISALGFLGAAIAALTAGCGAAAEPGTSTISGTIDQATFPAAVSQILVISDSSAPTSAPVAADGSFALTLTEGASYRFALGADDTIPLIVRSDAERLQTMITITGGGASANIGSVRFWAGTASSSTAEVQGVPATDTVTTTDDTCVDGLVPRTGQPCATGEATATCEDMGGHRGPGGRHHSPPDGFEKDHDEAEVAAPDPATDASPEQPVAIPELNLALGIGCGGCPGM